MSSEDQQRGWLRSSSPLYAFCNFIQSNQTVSNFPECCLIVRSGLPLLEQIARKLGLPQLEHQRWARHPLVYLMEAADDICYALIDLEDGLEMELLQYAEVEALLLDLVGDDLPETYRQLGPCDSRRRKLAILRGKAIEHLTNAAARAFVEQQQALLAGQLPGDLVEHMHGPAKRCVLQAKDMARNKIFQDKRKTPARNRRLYHLGNSAEYLL